MKVVTGATGYIGGVLVRALADRGDPVRAVFHERSGIFDAPGVEWVRGDVLDRDSMVAAFRDADVVFHLASLVSIEPRMADSDAGRERGGRPQRGGSRASGAGCGAWSTSRRSAPTTSFRSMRCSTKRAAG